MERLSVRLTFPAPGVWRYRISLYGERDWQVFVDHLTTIEPARIVTKTQDTPHLEFS